MRGVIRKHKDISWAHVCKLLENNRWINILFDQQYASFGGFSKKEKHNTNIIRYSFRIQSYPKWSVKRELKRLEEQSDEFRK